MRSMRLSITLTSILAFCVSAPPRAASQSKSDMVVRSESRLVLVDTVVADKKGAYITDLAQKDFHVSEDGKEQPIKTFAFAATPGGKARQQYVVIFFDNRMQPAEEMRARDAASKLVAANNGPDKFFAVINFGGILRVTQNFTSDPELILPAIQGKYLGLSGKLASLTSDDVTDIEGDFSAGSVLQGLRSLAKGMSRIQGRKSIIFITTGFALAADRYYELQAAVDACNKANIAVYPLDVKGLFITPGKTADSGDLRPPVDLPAPKWTDGVYHPGSNASLRPLSFEPPAAPQKGGQPNAGGGGGGQVRPGMLGTYIPDQGSANIRRPPVPVADVTKNLSEPHSVLYALAEGTGGFVILNTNDIVGGMQKITQEQSAYYMLGYVPAPAPEGSCHRLKVKVDRPGVVVRSRNTYCTVKPVDLLAGDPAEKLLESHLDDSNAAASPVTVTAPFFYTTANVARVNLALDVPEAVLKLEGSGAKLHKDVNILGIAYKQDGSVAARFSDSVSLQFDKKQAEALHSSPYHYEKQFRVASGDYTLKIVLGSGADVLGRAEMPLKIDPYDSKKLSMSALALTNRLVDLQANKDLADQAMLSDKALLVVDGMQFVPSAVRRFKRTEPALMYMEVYEPQLLEQPTAAPSIQLRYQVLDLNTGATVMDTGLFTPSATIRPGYPVVPVGLKLMADRLQPGSYRVTVQARNAAGQLSPVRGENFDVE